MSNEIASSDKAVRQGFFRRRMVALWGVLILMGPGIITSNVDNDAGGITTYSLAGAEFGLSMLWSLIPITVVLFIVQEMGARMGVVSGKGLSDLIRERFGVKLTFYLMILLVLTNLGNTLAEFAGIAASLEIFGLSRYLTVPLSILFLMWLAVKGTYKSVEKVFLTACLFYVSYVVTGFLVRPDWLEVVRSVAAPTLRTDSAFLVMLVGLVGTTIAPWMQFYLQASVVDKGLASKDLGAVRIRCHYRLNRGERSGLLHYPRLRGHPVQGRHKGRNRGTSCARIAAAGRILLHLAFCLRSLYCFYVRSRDFAAVDRVYSLRSLRLGIQSG